MDHFEATFTPDYGTLLSTTAVLGKCRYPSGLRWQVNAVYFSFMVIAGGMLGGVSVFLWHRVSPLAGIAFAALFSLALIGFTRAVLMPWVVRKSASSIAAVKPAEPNTFTADAQGMRWVDTTTDFRLRWAGVEAIFAANQTLSFMTSAIAMTVPLAAFRDDDERRQFLALAIRHLPPEVAERARSEASLAALL